MIGSLRWKSNQETEKGVQVSPGPSRAAQDNFHPIPFESFHIYPQLSLEILLQLADGRSNDYQTVRIKFKKKEVWRIRTDREYRTRDDSRPSYKNNINPYYSAVY